MERIDFQQFNVYTTVSRKAARPVDVRERFADMIYNNVNGIKAHALALKIYKSEGETEYSEEEVKLIRAVAEQWCVPGFIDGLNEQVNNKLKTE
jgi:hypothetical protein|nr:MAG TPA: hypothetical protein [Caudoviricetes sp.]